MKVIETIDGLLKFLSVGFAFAFIVGMYILLTIAFIKVHSNDLLMLTFAFSIEAVILYGIHLILSSSDMYKAYFSGE